LKICVFILEDIQLQEIELASWLLALMAITFTLVFAVWRRQAIVKELKLKKYGYPTKSLFPLGSTSSFA